MSDWYGVRDAACPLSTEGGALLSSSCACKVTHSAAAEIGAPGVAHGRRGSAGAPRGLGVQRSTDSVNSPGSAGARAPAVCGSLMKWTA